MSDFEVIAPYFIFALGACLGSFANVVIYRLPAGLSVVSPGSRCSHCLKPVSWYDNIPLLSWFILRGRCRSCHQTFSIRYVLVEWIMAILFCACYLQYGITWTTLELLIFIFGLVVCVFIDFDHMILPDEFTLSGIVIGIIGSILNPERNLLDSFLGFILGGGFLWLIAYLYFLFTKNEGMGGGDIKLLAWVGAVLGWKAIPFIILVSAISGSIVGVALAIKNNGNLKTAIPFGPYLALGSLVYVFGGTEIAQIYFDFFLPGF